MNAKEFHAAARRIEGLQRKLCGTEVELDAWKRSYQDLSKSAHRELTEVRVAARKEIERTREEQRNVCLCHPQSVLIEEQRRLLAAKQTEIGALEAERDEMKEEIKQANKEASDATARQRMTEARALNYSLQAEEARREIERLRSEVESLRAKLASRTVEWPEWARDGARVVVKSCDSYCTDASIGFEFVIAEIDRGDSTVGDGKGTWVCIFDLEPVAEHT